MPRHTRRKKNPSWIITSLFALGGLVVGAGIAGAAMRRSKVASLFPTYYYWAEDRGGAYVPVIQNAATGERFEFPDTVTEYAALKNAKDAIYERGGEPLEGKPLNNNPQRPRSVRATTRSTRR